VAHEADEIPYIEILAEYWGDLCASAEVASRWGDRLIEIARLALSPDPKVRGHFHGTSACLSALFRAERYAEILGLVPINTIWHYQEWAVRARIALGDKAEAIRHAESSRGPWTPDEGVDRLCEEILLSSGLVGEAYARYGRRANRRGTYLATFRAIAKKYPDKAPLEILVDLVADTPGEEGKWFAAAKEARFYQYALELARRSPCDPRTLARAAHDFAEVEPRFAVDAGLLALVGLVEGRGYEVTSRDVWDAYSSTMRAAEAAGTAAETRASARRVVAGDAPGGFVRRILERDLM
jgi:hypothetical protein